MILDDPNIDKLVIHKLRTVEKSFERYYEEIADSNFDTNKLKILKTDDAEKIIAFQNLKKNWIV